MKKYIIIFIVFIVIFFVTSSIYRASVLSKKFDELHLMDFESIGILEYNGIEHLYGNGSDEFKIIKGILFELLGIIYPTDYDLKRGEAKDGIDIILKTKKGDFYKLCFGYAPSVNTLQITIINKQNFYIVKYYYLENNDAIKLLNLRNVF